MGSFVRSQLPVCHCGKAAAALPSSLCRGGRPGQRRRTSRAAAYGLPAWQPHECRGRNPAHLQLAAVITGITVNVVTVRRCSGLVPVLLAQPRPRGHPHCGTLAQQLSLAGSESVSDS